MRTLHKGLSEKQAVTLSEGMGFIQLNPFFSGGGFITGVVFVAAALLSQFVGIFYRISKKSKGLKGDGGMSEEDGEITAD